MDMLLSASLLEQSGGDPDHFGTRPETGSAPVVGEVFLEHTRHSSPPGSPGYSNQSDGDAHPGAGDDDVAMRDMEPPGSRNMIQKGRSPSVPHAVMTGFDHALILRDGLEVVIYGDGQPPPAPVFHVQCGRSHAGGKIYFKGAGNSAISRRFHGWPIRGWVPVDAHTVAILCLPPTPGSLPPLPPPRRKKEKPSSSSQGAGSGGGGGGPPRLEGGGGSGTGSGGGGGGLKRPLLSPSGDDSGAPRSLTSRPVRSAPAPARYRNGAATGFGFANASAEPAAAEEMYEGYDDGGGGTTDGGGADDGPGALSHRKGHRHGRKERRVGGLATAGSLNGSLTGSLVRADSHPTAAAAAAAAADSDAGHNASYQSMPAELAGFILGLSGTAAVPPAVPPAGGALPLPAAVLRPFSHASAAKPPMSRVHSAVRLGQGGGSSANSGGVPPTGATSRLAATGNSYPTHGDHAADGGPQGSGGDAGTGDGDSDGSRQRAQGSGGSLEAGEGTRLPGQAQQRGLPPIPRPPSRRKPMKSGGGASSIMSRPVSAVPAATASAHLSHFLSAASAASAPAAAPEWPVSAFSVGAQMPLAGSAFAEALAAPQYPGTLWQSHQGMMPGFPALAPAVYGLPGVPFAGHGLQQLPSQQAAWAPPAWAPPAVSPLPPAAATLTPTAPATVLAQAATPQAPSSAPATASWPQLQDAFTDDGHHSVSCAEAGVQASASPANAMDSEGAARALAAYVRHFEEHPAGGGGGGSNGGGGDRWEDAVAAHHLPSSKASAAAYGRMCGAGAGQDGMSRVLHVVAEEGV